MDLRIFLNLLHALVEIARFQAQFLKLCLSVVDLFIAVGDLLRQAGVLGQNTSCYARLFSEAAARKDGRKYKARRKKRQESRHRVRC